MLLHNIYVWLNYFITLWFNSIDFSLCYVTWCCAAARSKTLVGYNCTSGILSYTLLCIMLSYIKIQCFTLRTIWRDYDKIFVWRKKTVKRYRQNQHMKSASSLGNKLIHIVYDSNWHDHLRVRLNAAGVGFSALNVTNQTPSPSIFTSAASWCFLTAEEVWSHHRDCGCCGR